MERPDLGPCPVCGEKKRISFSKKQGINRITSSKWYRELVRCNSCRTEVSGVSPGRAVKVWGYHDNH